MRKHNWHPKIIEAYLKKYYKNIGTRNTARVYLKHFFITMNEEPEKFIKKSKKEITKIIWKYAEKIEDRAPKTQTSMLSFIKKFLMRNKKSIEAIEWEDIRLRNNLKRVSPITKKKTPTIQELKKILSYTTGIKAKSLFVFCASSGVRIDEALKLTFDDIDMDKRKVELIDDVPKFNISRYTYFTPEAKELLELWIPEREKMLQTRYKKSKYLRDKLEKQGYEIVKVKRADVTVNGRKYPLINWKICKDGRELTKDEIIALDRRIWPFDYINAVRMWLNLLEKAGKPFNETDTNPKLKFRKYLHNEHCLRRFWFTQLVSDRTNEEFVNFMGGHTSDLSKTYKDFESEIMRRNIKEEYDKHLGCLSIFEALLDLSGVHEQLKEKDKALQVLKQEIDDNKREIMELRLTVLELKNEK